MDSPNPQPKNKVAVNTAAIGFLVISLIAITFTVSDPLREQLIKSFAAQETDYNKNPFHGYDDKSLVINANALPNRPGFDCVKNPGVCPKGVEISGFYQAADGQWYPINQNQGGPSKKDLEYIAKNIEEKNKPKDETAPVSLDQSGQNPFSGSLQYNDDLTKIVQTGPTLTPVPTGDFTKTNANNPFTGVVEVSSDLKKVTQTGPTLKPVPTGNLTKTNPNNPFAGVINVSPDLKTVTQSGPTLEPVPTDLALKNVGNPFISRESVELQNQIDQATQFPEKPPVGSSDYTCTDGYLLKQNRFGAYFCQEDPKNVDPSEYSLRCDTDGCLKCGTGWIGFCYDLDSQAPIAPTAPVTNIAQNKKQLGEKCNSASDCGSGNCASSWIMSDGSKSFSTQGSVCTYDQKTQMAYDAARVERESNVVAQTLAGLSLPAFARNFATALARPPVDTDLYTYATWGIINLRNTALEGQGYYSISQNARITISGNEFFNKSTASKLAMNSTGVSESAFKSPEWRNINEAIQTQTIKDPNNIMAITDAVHNSLIVRNFDTKTIGGKARSSLTYPTLKGLLSENPLISKDFAATEQYYLAQKNIPTQTVEFKVDGDPRKSHTILLLIDKNGNKCAIDPVENKVIGYDAYLKQLKATDVKVTSLPYGISPNTPDFTVVPLE